MSHAGMIIGILGLKIERVEFVYAGTYRLTFTHRLQSMSQCP